jgi:hypothetical protein
MPCTVDYSPSQQKFDPFKRIMKPSGDGAVELESNRNEGYRNSDTELTERWPQTVCRWGFVAGSDCKSGNKICYLKPEYQSKGHEGVY